MAEAVELRVDWCSYEAAKYAVEKWHYSRTMPAGKTVRVGAWEDGRFIGCVLFAWGSNRHIGRDFGLNMLSACELVRVALSNHVSFTSHILAKAIKKLRQGSPGIRLIVSLADPYEGHVGGIYQATNWVYVGFASDDKRVQRYVRNGKVKHWRTIAQELNDKGMQSTAEDAQKLGYTPLGHIPKHKYLYPLDRAMRKQIAPLAQPYPKRDARPVEGDTLATSEAGRFDPDPDAPIVDKVTL